jgi:hypothetical protein
MLCIVNCEVINVIGYWTLQNHMRCGGVKVEYQSMWLNPKDPMWCDFLDVSFSVSVAYLLLRVLVVWMQAKAKARAMAIALQTIGKFIIKKKVGENDQIFGRCGMRPCVVRG